jgi:hypothetical protein
MMSFYRKTIDLADRIALPKEMYASIWIWSFKLKVV